LTDILKRMSYNEKGELKTEVYFKGQKGILKSYDSGRVMIDSLFTREEKEAQFSGGEILWRRYLEQTLNASTPVNNGARNGIYQVIVRFIVAKDGSISNVTSETKHGYGMEQEVIRIIQNGPAWEPAIQYGRKVNAYRRQPVTFVVQ
jgi:protein TonB